MISDLNWLPLSDRKNIDLPKVYWEEYAGQNYAGYYVASDILKDNYIVVVYCSEWVSNYKYHLEDILAHEFRHHIQKTLSLFKTLDSKVSTNPNYEEGIKEFFSSYSHEMDALQYSLSLNKADMQDYWYRKLLNKKYV